MQSKSRIDPTMKVVDGPARHSSMPAAKRDCASAVDGAQARTTNAAASAPAERIMAVSPFGRNHHNRTGEAAKTGRERAIDINIKTRRATQGLPCAGAL